MSLEHPLTFYGRYLWETLSKHGRFLVMVLRYLRALYRAQTRLPQTPAIELVTRPASAPLTLTETQEAAVLAGVER
jgi:hypothetical protein